MDVRTVTESEATDQATRIVCANEVSLLFGFVGAYDVSRKGNIRCQLKRKYTMSLKRKYTMSVEKEINNMIHGGIKTLCKL